MDRSVQRHVMQQIAEAPLISEPFPHFYAEKVFPDEFYAEMLDRLPSEDNLTCHAESGLVRPGTYKERFIFRFRTEDLGKLRADDRAFWLGVDGWLNDQNLLSALVAKFSPYVEQRFGAESIELEAWQDSMLVRDTRNYSLGPHTDVKHRLLSMLFYLPRDGAKPHLGTSIYRPRDPDFTCPGGPHHPFELFELVRTVPYKPNTVFGFLKNERSFHGVERIEDDDARRDLMMYEAKLKKVKAYRSSDRNLAPANA